MRDFRSWHKPLIRLRHLLPARRGEKGNKARVSRESCLLPLAPLAGRGCRRRVRGHATSDTLPSRRVSCPQSRRVRRSTARDDERGIAQRIKSGKQWTGTRATIISNPIKLSELLLTE